MYFVYYVIQYLGKIKEYIYLWLLYFKIIVYLYMIFNLTINRLLSIYKLIGMFWNWGNVWSCFIYLQLRVFLFFIWIYKKVCIVRIRVKILCLKEKKRLIGIMGCYKKIF